MSRQTTDLRRPVLILAATLVVAGAAQAAAPVFTDGPDTVIGGPGPDTLQGRGGDDFIRGMDGDDIVYGNGGDDTVGGGPGNDQVRGGRGADQVNGGQGDDTIGGDRGDDVLAGGPGADRFVFDNQSGSDTILDFNSADGDRIELPAGFDYTAADTPAGLVLQLGGGGGRLLLAGVKFSALGDWQAKAAGAASPPLHLPTAANPPPAPSKGLLAAIVVLSIAFVGLLGVGLAQLVRAGRGRRL